MVMRKPTGPDGAAPDTPDTPVGPEPAVPYDPSEWDRRLAEARERRAKILALRGMDGDAAARPVPIPPVAGLFAGETAGPPVAPPARARPAAPGAPAGPGFEGRMDRIARAMETARQRRAETDPQPLRAAEPVRKPAEPRREPRAPAVPPDRPGARPAATPVAADPGPRRSRLVPALALGLAAAAGLAGGAYLFGHRAPAPAVEAVALADPETGAMPPGVAQPEPDRQPERPSATAPDTPPGSLPSLQAVALPAAPAGALVADLPAAPVAPAEAAALTDPAVEMGDPAGPQPAPRPGTPLAAGAAPVDPSVAAAPPDPAAASDPMAPADAVAAAAPVAPVVADPAAFRLRVSAPATASAAEVEAVGTVLAGAGFPGVATQRVGFTVSRTHLRYYNPEDAAAAQAIAGRLGVEARDFTGYRPKPAAGTIEVWIAGTAPGGTARAARSTQPQNSPPPSPARAVQEIGQAVRTLVETFPANEQR